MRKLRLLLGMAGALVVAAALAGSLSAASGPSVCMGGQIAAGTYNNLIVAGTCTFADGLVTVRGNLTLGRGAILNDHAQAQATTVHVTGNVLVGKGGVLGLGNYNPVPPHTSAVVDGSVLADRPGTLYLGGMTIHGRRVSVGGGDPTRNFPIKDDQIDGQVAITGFRGLWWGLIRTTVGGNAILTNNRATDISTLPGVDSSEVVTNTIRGSLLCFANVPVAQVGDSEGATNTVGGFKLGECAGL
jgi:hypothetical protein